VNYSLRLHMSNAKKKETRHQEDQQIQDKIELLRGTTVVWGQLLGDFCTSSAIDYH